MYIGKFKLQNGQTNEITYIPIYFKKPSLNDVNNILRKYKLPSITIKDYKILYDDDRIIFLKCNSLHSISFIKKEWEY